MKHTLKVHFFAGFLAAGLLFSAAGCDTPRPTYSAGEYVMFADSVSVNMILQDQEYFSVPIATTKACAYDRNFGVEILDRNSTAIERLHYRLQSNTVTIPAGKLSAEVRVHADYDKFESGDTLRFTLRLVMPEQLIWNLYGNTTRVEMVKSCPFSEADFSGWCVVTSMFLNTYPGVENRSMQRLVRTEPHPAKEHTVILHDWLFTGYDVELEFDPSDPAAPLVSMAPDQVLSDEQSVFGQINGDDRILVADSPVRPSYFNACERYVSLWIRAYVENLGEPVGTVGTFYNILEWVSDEEAERLQRENGM